MAAVEHRARGVHAAAQRARRKVRGRRQRRWYNIGGVVRAHGRDRRRPDGGRGAAAAAGAVAAAATAARRAAASSARSVAIVAAFFSASVRRRAFSLSNCARRFISEAARRAWSWSGSPLCFEGGEGRRRTGERLFGGFPSATFGLLGVSGFRRRADIVAAARETLRVGCSAAIYFGSDALMPRSRSARSAGQNCSITHTPLFVPMCALNHSAARARAV